MKGTLFLAAALFLTASVYGQGGVATSEDYSDVQFAEITPASGYQPDEEDRHSYLLFSPLNAYPDVFTSLSDYNFSFVRYNRRGYDFRYSRVSVGGIELTDELSGYTLWNVLSALRGARQSEQLTVGIVPGEGSLGSVGGERYLSPDTDDRQRGGRAGWIITDRRFRTGFRFNANTGWLRGGWAFSVAGARRWGRDAHIDGVYTDSWALYASLMKRLGTKHRLAASFAAAPTEQGVRGAATAGAFSLTANNLYNPYWGYQNGEVRNSRVRKSDQPLALLSWEFKPVRALTVNTSLAYAWGTNGYSSLDWYDAPNPTPDYYRYMPGFFANPDVADAVREEWERGNTRVTQVDWDELYYVNRHGGDAPATYVVSSRMTAQRNLQFVSRFRYDASSLMRWDGGLRVRRDAVNHYNRLDDLLGGTHLNDIDQFLVDDEYYGDKLQNNMRDPERKIGLGDRYGYNYDMRYRSYEGWAVARMRSRALNGRLHGYAGLQLGWVTMEREGYYEKEQFAGNLSFGRSPRLDFTTYMVKGGIGYSFSPSHHLELGAVYGDVAPVAENLFISPDYQNRTIGETRPVNLLSAEARYAVSGSWLEFMLNGYVTVSQGESDVYHFYDDLSSSYSNLALTEIDKLYAGVEIGAGVSFTQRLSLRVGGALSNNSYKSDPAVRQYADKDGSVIVENVRSYIKGYKLNGTPQTVGSAELRYSGAHMWLATLSVNYTARNYISMNPIRRMKRISEYGDSPGIRQQLIAQEQFGAATTLNIFLSKTFRLGAHYLSLTLSVNNIANKKNMVYSGYEQMRLAKAGTGLNQTLAPFGSKYYYAYGRTYYGTVNFRF